MGKKPLVVWNWWLSGIPMPGAVLNLRLKDFIRRLIMQKHPSDNSSKRAISCGII